MNQLVFGNVTWFMLLAQMFGVFGLIMNFFSFQQNTNKRIVGIQIFGALFFSIHFLAMMVGTIALFLINTKLTRRFSLVGSIGWITYNALLVAIPGFISEIFTITSIVSAMIKFDFKKNNEYEDDLGA